MVQVSMEVCSELQVMQTLFARDLQLRVSDRKSPFVVRECSGLQVMQTVARLRAVGRDKYDAIVLQLSRYATSLPVREDKVRSRATLQ